MLNELPKMIIGFSQILVSAFHFSTHEVYSFWRGRSEMTELAQTCIAEAREIQNQFRAH